MSAVQSGAMRKGDLSDEEIKQLLQTAEQRLREAAALEKDAMPKRVTLSTSANAVLIPTLPNSGLGSLDQTYITFVDGVARIDPGRLLKNSVHKAASKWEERKIDSKTATAGEQRLFIPRAGLTHELKRDLQLLKMRGVLDSSRHYKKESAKGLVAEFSQVGRVVEGPREWFSARIPNREREKTLAGEVLAVERSTGRFKNKYMQVLELKSNGKKTFYKKLKQDRSRRARKR